MFYFLITIHMRRFQNVHSSCIFNNWKGQLDKCNVQAGLEHYQNLFQSKIKNKTITLHMHRFQICHSSCHFESHVGAIKQAELSCSGKNNNFALACDSKIHYSLESCTTSPGTVDKNPCRVSKYSALCTNTCPACFDLSQYLPCSGNVPFSVQSFTKAFKTLYSDIGSFLQ